ncbi:MAG: YidC/Oxa1 family membrane protein insertase [Treponema sp.]|nr:YidC/Oxa1 family membrane protein insertase [Treponema sp.]
MILAVRLLPEKAKKYFQAAIYALTFSLFAQGYLLGNSYGLLDGEKINWGRHWLSGIISCLVWLAIFAVVFISLWKNEKKARSALSFMLVVTLALQFFILSYLFTTRKESDVQREVFLSKEKQFDLSTGKNTIVFLLDCFDAKLFSKLLENDEYQIPEKFEDFTFYKNMSGGATRTKYAIPYIFTGRTNTEPVSYLEYVRRSYAQSPFVQTLRKKDIDARILTDTWLVSPDETKAFANLKIQNSKQKVSHPMHLALHFCKLTAFCFVPVPAKRLFWMYPDFDRWVTDERDESAYSIGDIRFYNEMKKKLSAPLKKDVFRFYHLFGAHGSYTMSENCERIPESEGSEERQARGSLKIVHDFISMAKKLGIYDEMTIFVMSDHGCGGLEQNPLFMLKERGVSKTFSISDSPCTYKDMPLIYKDAVLGDTIDMEGKYSHPGEERFFYKWVQDTAKVDIIEWSGKGHASDESSYTKTGTVYHGNSENNGSYRIGKKLFFSAAETANPYCTEGFAHSEGDLTWTEGTKAEMYFKLKGYRKGKDLRLRMSYEVYAEGQRVGISVNGNELERYAAENGEKEILIPGEYIGNNEIYLTFDFPDTDISGITGINDNPCLRTLGMIEVGFRYAHESFWTWLKDNPAHAIYSMTIGLIEALVGFVFGFIISHLPGFGVIGAVASVSLTINLLALPLYNMADKLREKERKTAKSLEYRVKRIKKAFKGDERFMMLTTYYRQNNYSPLYALRSSLSILIEIPLFIAAYRFLSHCPDLGASSFWIITNLDQPDGLLHIPASNGKLAANILPILMTAINIVSGAIYTKMATTSEKVQQYALAGLFLMLLYKSPSGLVIYWIMNNIFSLIKNIIAGIRAKETV